uniref:HDC12384 n=1 Tax=Drosophila melanogaster TaxID=7227 RepID=Q6IKI3_DROME|nr:TPA_inf: HDC12384 [Drosophila melanogaster]
MLLLLLLLLLLLSCGHGLRKLTKASRLYVMANTIHFQLPYLLGQSPNSSRQTGEKRQLGKKAKILDKTSSSS